MTDYKTARIDKPTPPEIIDLAHKILKAAGKQNPVTLMNALLVCMKLIDSVHKDQPKKAEKDQTERTTERTTPNAQEPYV